MLGGRGRNRPRGRGRGYGGGDRGLAVRKVRESRVGRGVGTGGWGLGRLEERGRGLVGGLEGDLASGLPLSSDIWQ